MKKYDSLNGVRTIACIGIVLMHILTNSSYQLNNSVSSMIVSLTNFVFTFMILSAFSMSCGYYEKIKHNQITVEDFYKRRIVKTLPFFMFMVLIDIILEHNFESIVEGFADLTLLFGFLQKKLTVIGVGWFIGLIFIFYLIYPFFVFLFSNKKRAWFSTAIALLMHIVAIGYFGIQRTNMFYSFIYFCIGGLIYLYKEEIITIFRKNRMISIVLLLLSCTLITLNNTDEYMIFPIITLFSFMFIAYAISYDSKVLNNKVTSIIGKYSMEIYLSHMMIFRLLEKLKLNYFFKNDYISFLFVFCSILIGSLIVAFLFHTIINKIEKKELKNENNVSK